jgi:RNA polymerase sigma-70 factor, ECF subfamily
MLLAKRESVRTIPCENARKDTEIPKMCEMTSPTENSGGLLAAAGGMQESKTEVIEARRQEFENILRDSLPRFRNMASRRLGNREDAEDAVQDAMLSAFTHIAGFNGRAKMSTWLTVIVTNAVRMQIRRRPRVRMTSLDWVPKEGGFAISELLADPGPTPEKTLEQFELYELAVKLTRGLVPSQRRALRLYQQNEFSIRQSATKLGIPEGTLKAQLARGRATLAERFYKTLARPKAHTSKSNSQRGRASLSGHQRDCT